MYSFGFFQFLCTKWIGSFIKLITDFKEMSPPNDLLDWGSSLVDEIKHAQSYLYLEKCLLLSLLLHKATLQHLSITLAAIVNQYVPEWLLILLGDARQKYAGRQNI